MGNVRIRSWRGGVTSVALWALLTMAAALEVYDEVPEVEAYQDDNSVDMSPLPDRSPDLALAKDVMLYRLLQSLRGESSDYRPRYRPFLNTYNQPLRHPINEDSSEKDAMVKRLTEALRGTRTNMGFKSAAKMYRPQQKWKIKKGKALGSHYRQVCYFKLCAFRSPV